MGKAAGRDGRTKRGEITYLESEIEFYWLRNQSWNLNQAGSDSWKDLMQHSEVTMSSDYKSKVSILKVKST